PDLVSVPEAVQRGVRLPKRGPGRHAVRKKLRARGLDRQVDLLRGLNFRPAQDLRVELVGPGHELGLLLEEALQEGWTVDREAIPVGLPLEGVHDALLPVDQGAIAIRGYPLDVFQLWKGHESRGSIAIWCFPPLLTPSARLIGPRVPSRGLGSARVSGKAALRRTRCPRTRRAGRRHRRRSRAGCRGDRLSVRDQGAGADRWPRQGRRDQG